MFTGEDTAAADLRASSKIAFRLGALLRPFFDFRRGNLLPHVLWQRSYRGRDQNNNKDYPNPT
jgi:hypothetical protein